MSKEEYADQTRTYTAYFRAGEIQERKRILKLIDEKIQFYKEISLNDTIIKQDCLEELKEELKRK
jgi:hypothetical protein